MPAEDARPRRGSAPGAARRRPRPARALRRLAAAALILAGCAVPPLDQARVSSHPATADIPAGSRLELLSVIELRSDSPSFAGWSALEVAQDGSRLVALADRGLWMEAEIARPEGPVAGLRDARLGLLTEAGARPPQVGVDSEGLAIPADDLSGPRFASFERLARILRVEGRDGLPFAEDPAWAGFSGNSGLEALAVPPEGGLLALQEAPDGRQGAVYFGPPRGFGGVGAWRIDPQGRATRGLLPRLGEYSVTGADFGPDGRLYVLARLLALPGGFSFAVWRFDWVEGEARGGEVLMELPAGRGADNAEGLSAWRDGRGRLRLAVITDDNFSLIQRTLLYDFVLKP